MPTLWSNECRRQLLLQEEKLTMQRYSRSSHLKSCMKQVTFTSPVWAFNLFTEITSFGSLWRFWLPSNVEQRFCTTFLSWDRCFTGSIFDVQHSLLAKLFFFFKESFVSWLFARLKSNHRSSLLLCNYLLKVWSSKYLDLCWLDLYLVWPGSGPADIGRDGDDQVPCCFRSGRPVWHCTLTWQHRASTPASLILTSLLSYFTLQYWSAGTRAWRGAKQLSNTLKQPPWRGLSQAKERKTVRTRILDLLECRTAASKFEEVDTL